MHGRGADDLVLKVPPGTIIKSVETDEVLGDLVEDGQRLCRSSWWTRWTR